MWMLAFLTVLVARARAQNRQKLMWHDLMLFVSELGVISFHCCVILGPKFFNERFSLKYWTVRVPAAALAWVDC